jgi:DNA polymerase-3 subunit gamma/tau
MRDALSLLDQVYSFCHERIDEKEVRSVLGLVEHEIYSSLLDAISGKKPDRTIAAVEEVLQKGYDLEEFLTGLEEHVRNLLFARIPGALDSESRNPGPEILKKLTEQSNGFSEGDLLRMTELLHKAQSDLRWSTYPRFLVEITLLKMAYMDSTLSIEQLLSSAKGSAPAVASVAGANPQQALLKKKPEAAIIAAAPMPQTKSSETKTPEPQPTQSLENKVLSRPVQDTTESFDVPDKPLNQKPVDSVALWHDFLALLISDRPNLGSFLSIASVAAVTESSIDVRFPPQYSFQFAETTRKPNRDIINEKLNTFAGRQMELHISIESQSHADKTQAAHEANTEKAVSPSLGDDMEQEPVIKTVIDLFDAEAV